MYFKINPQHHNEISLCLRFKTPHFNLEETDDEFTETPVYGSVLSLVSMEPLLFWPALDCDDTGYSGCTAARREAAGERWGRGKDSPTLLTSRDSVAMPAFLCHKEPA